MRLGALTENEARRAMETGEFGEETVGKAGRVALVLTQGWCPQWTSMRRYLENPSPALASADIEVRYFVYDESPIFLEFMGFKENSFGNDQVPYVRYYRDGKVEKRSNYVSEGVFLHLAAGE